MTFTFKKALLFSALALVANNSFSHGAWLAERTGEPTIIYGHGNHDDSYKAAKLTIVKGFDKDGNVRAIEKKAADKNVALVIPDDISYIGFVFDNGYWTKNKEGKWKNKPKTDVEGATEGGHYIKNAIAVIDKAAAVKPVKGLALQILPLENPLKKQAGDTLNIQVLFNGKPLEGANIIRDYVNMSHKKSGKTDKDGKASITIRNQGLNVIGASYTETLTSNPKADKNGYTATLSFELEHIDED